MIITNNICFFLAKRRALNKSVGSVGKNPATFDNKSYQYWRAMELKKQFSDYFDLSELQDRDVLDFGCGGGDLSFFVANERVKSVTGVDLNRELIESASSRIKDYNLRVKPNFLCAANERKIDLPDSSVDLILCFDVLEHIMAYNEILSEWKRILRPNGKVFIWWIPWYHPYGHHIESLVPIPWVHVFFSDKTLINTCRRIYDLPEFQPRIWDLDVNGQKKPNKWLFMEKLPDVNRLTMAQFEKLCHKVELKIKRRESRGFGSSSVAKLTNFLIYVPFFREFFTSSVIYELQKNSLS